ncbi:MAG: hypothetical protein GY929_02235 [Actinomycetia bacterium]|nr:hypothetical protein [Actinomycetes bacterium]
MRFYRILLVIGLLGGAASYGSSLGAEEEPDISTQPEVQLMALDPTVEAKQPTLISDPLAVVEVQTAIENLIAADALEYSWVAGSEAKGARSTVTKSGAWDRNDRTATLTTEIAVLDAPSGINPFGQLADALSGENQRTGEIITTLADDVITTVTNGGAPKTAPASIRANEVAALDPRRTLLTPLLAELTMVESGTAVEGGISYRAVVDSDAVAPLAVEALVSERLADAGFDGVAGVRVPATIVVADSGAITVTVDLSLWWAAVEAEAPAVSSTTATLRLHVTSPAPE